MMMINHDDGEHDDDQHDNHEHFVGSDDLVMSGRYSLRHHQEAVVSDCTLHCRLQ